MKKFFVVMLLWPWFAVAAGGPWDGIYNCAVAGGSSSQAFVTLNGKPNGETIFAVAAINPTQSFYGYGTGQIVGINYSGWTGLGGRFNVNATTTGFTGTVGALSGGGFINLALNCIKIY